MRDGKARSIELFSDIVSLDAALGESPPKGILKRSKSHQLTGIHVTFAQAAKGTSATSLATFSHGTQPVKSAGSGPSRLQDGSLGPAKPARSVSGRSSGTSSGSRVFPPKQADLRPSTPTKSNSDSKSRGSSFGIRTPVDKRRLGAANFQSPTSPGVQAWNNWDAKKADEELAEKRRLEEEAAPKIDRTKLVFKEIYRPTTLNKDGERVAASGACRRVVARSDVGLDSSASSHSFVSGSPAPKKSGDRGYSKDEKNLLEGFAPRPTSKTGMPQNPKKGSTEAGPTSVMTSGMLGLSLHDHQLPAFGTDSTLPRNDEKSGQISRTKKQLPSARGRSFDWPRGEGSFRGGNRQPQLTGDLMTWEAPTMSTTSPMITEEPTYSTLVQEMGDIYGSSPPRSRAQRNSSAAAIPSRVPRQDDSASQPTRGAPSQKPKSNAN